MSAAISARRSPTCKPTDRIARSRNPATVSSAARRAFARLRFREGEGRAFVAIDRRPLDLADRVLRGVVVADQVLVERGQGREAPADRRRCGVLALAHVALPGDHRLVVGLAQFRRRGDRQCAHEVLHVEPVGAAGARALLLGSQISSSGICASWSRVESPPAPLAIRTGNVPLSSIIATGSAAPSYRPHRRTLAPPGRCLLRRARHSRPPSRADVLSPARSSPRRRARGSAPQGAGAVSAITVTLGPWRCSLALFALWTIACRSPLLNPLLDKPDYHAGERCTRWEAWRAAAPGFGADRRGWGINNHVIAIEALYCRSVEPVERERDSVMELAIPDLDLINQVKQGAWDRRGRGSGRRRRPSPAWHGRFLGDDRWGGDRPPDSLPCSAGLRVQLVAGHGF